MGPQKACTADALVAFRLLVCQSYSFMRHPGLFLTPYTTLGRGYKTQMISTEGQMSILHKAAPWRFRAGLSRQSWKAVMTRSNWMDSWLLGKSRGSMWGRKYPVYCRGDSFSAVCAEKQHHYLSNNECWFSTSRVCLDEAVKFSLPADGEWKGRRERELNLINH